MVNTTHGNNYLHLLDFKGDYSEINREERHLTAILFHLLQDHSNLEKFVLCCGEELVGSVSDTIQIYYEFAYIRDLWHLAKADNSTRRKVFVAYLPKRISDQVEELSPVEINKFFGVEAKSPYEHIASPSRWNLKKLKEKCPNEQEFLSICKFKWSFNAKPDLVIMLGNNRAICIEAKSESPESKCGDKGLPKVKQTELQKFLMQDMLGFKSKHVKIVKRRTQSESEVIKLRWQQVFECFGLGQDRKRKEQPKYIRDAIGKFMLDRKD